MWTRKFLLASLVFQVSIAPSHEEASKQKNTPTTGLAVQSGHLRSGFEANVGQCEPTIKFLYRSNSYMLGLMPDAVLATLRQPGSSTNSLRMKFVNADPRAELVGLQELSRRSNYFIGNDPEKWHSNVPAFGKVLYRRIYPGIDIIFDSRQPLLKFDVLVAPGANFKSVKFAFEGIRRLEIDEEGDLRLETELGELRQHLPAIYQEGRGTRRAVLGRFVLAGRNEVGFDVGEFDSSRPLIIDPVVTYSSYLGGRGAERPLGIAVDASGHIYLTGDTMSADFPTKNPVQSAFGGNTDAFVVKLDHSGSKIIYSTYIGGGQIDSSYGGIAVDEAGNAYITGVTQSKDFPTVKALQPTFGGEMDAFVVKLNATGSEILTSTYLGGIFPEHGLGIAVDRDHNIYVTGDTFSANFPTYKPLQESFAGFVDVFISKLNPSGSAFVYSTYLGGGQVDASYGGIAVDDAGNVFVAGTTQSPDFPVANALQPNLAGLTDAFVTKLNASGSAFVYSTYLGGSYSDQALRIGLDRAGNSYITGVTFSHDFPTANALQKSHAGQGDAFIAKLDFEGSALMYCSYLGGNAFDRGVGLAVGSGGAAYIIGTTFSADLPLVHPVQRSLQGFVDAFVAKIDPAGKRLLFSTYLGGEDLEEGLAIALDGHGNILATGTTFSADFPVANAFQAVLGGDRDIFVARVEETR